MTNTTVIVWTGALSTTGAYLGTKGTVKNRGDAAEFATPDEARRAVRARGWIPGTWSIMPA